MVVAVVVLIIVVVSCSDGFSCISSNSCCRTYSVVFCTAGTVNLVHYVPFLVCFLLIHTCMLQYSAMRNDLVCA